MTRPKTRPRRRHRPPRPELRFPELVRVDGVVCPADAPKWWLDDPHLGSPTARNLRRVWEHVRKSNSLSFGRAPLPEVDDG